MFHPMSLFTPESTSLSSPELYLPALRSFLLSDEMVEAVRRRVSRELVFKEGRAEAGEGVKQLVLAREIRRRRVGTVQELSTSSGEGGEGVDGAAEQGS
ncbi:hypothetical protein Syun_012880 [Stephania yunnanensis]|uniref:Uncharacterized protein n=1 Tax=Stephania yunnanensis TaxID=152371 RepID=A0AAP0K1A9_9MAGN